MNADEQLDDAGSDQVAAKLRQDLFAGAGRLYELARAAEKAGAPETAKQLNHEAGVMIKALRALKALDASARALFDAEVDVGPALHEPTEN